MKVHAKFSMKCLSIRSRSNEATRMLRSGRFVVASAGILTASAVFSCMIIFAMSVLLRGNYHIRGHSTVDLMVLVSDAPKSEKVRFGKTSRLSISVPREKLTAYAIDSVDRPIPVPTSGRPKSALPVAIDANTEIRAEIAAQPASTPTATYATNDEVSSNISQENNKYIAPSDDQLPPSENKSPSEESRLGITNQLNLPLVVDIEKNASPTSAVFGDLPDHKFPNTEAEALLPKRVAPDLSVKTGLNWRGRTNRVAIYDISAGLVYLPDGERLEAHSGVGRMRDIPSFSNVKMRGPTPPATYALSLREEAFHGVDAIRLTPVNGTAPFGRVGLLAHTYMLRRPGDSNGCVVFANYDRFLKAFRRKEVNFLLVVPHLQDGLTSLQSSPARSAGLNVTFWRIADFVRSPATHRGQRDHCAIGLLHCMARVDQPMPSMKRGTRSVSDSTSKSFMVFVGHRLVLSGSLVEATLAVKQAVEADASQAILVFDDATGRVVDVDFRGTGADIVERSSRPASAYVGRYRQPPEELPNASEPTAGSGTRGKGRPKMGVIAREVTLLPRQWEWLASQSGGASATLRKLVDSARRSGSSRHQQRAAQDTAYQFMQAIAGDLPGYEEATRALFANDRPGVERCVAAWPRDIRTQAIRLAFERNIVAANGIDVAYDSFGDDDRAVILLISGLGTQMIRWRVPFCEELAGRGFRVIRFDNRDAGLSSHFRHCLPPDFNALAAALMSGQRPEVCYTLDDMACDAVGLLDALAIDKAHVVGRSMGGMIAQMMASDHPDRVLSLSSIMSSTGNPTLPQAAPDVMAMMMQPTPDPFVDEAGFASCRLAFARRIAGSGYPLDEDDHRCLVLEEVRRAYDPGGSGRQFVAMAVTGDRRRRLATIARPALVIHGMDDPVFPPECGKDTAASIRDADLMVLEGMGHDVPTALYSKIIDAINRTARRA
eukprot:gene21198-27460_t